MTTGHTKKPNGDHDRPRPYTSPWSHMLLPNEPRILDQGTQGRLTDQYLLPALPELECCLLAVRQQLDPDLRQLQPAKYGKPYPQGQCLEIALAMQQRLGAVDEVQLPPEGRPGLRALRAFQRAGGAFRRVWGDLRGQYFQNAFQVGTLYIDVANDTVVPTKPKVEILPFSQAQFIPVRDYRHFSLIAASYWQDKIYPNHVLPALAPHCPLIHVSPSGQIRIHDASQYMLTLTHNQAFHPSEAMLIDSPMPHPLFEHLRNTLQRMGHPLPGTPEQGRQQALHYCRQYRDKRWHRQPGILLQAAQTTLRLNQYLAQRQRYITPEQVMPKITIANVAPEPGQR